MVGEQTFTAEFLATATGGPVLRLDSSETTSIVVKLKTTRARRQIDLGRTAAAMALASSAGVPVAKVHSAGLTEDWQHLIMDHLDGVPWRELRRNCPAPT